MFVSHDVCVHAVPEGEYCHGIHIVGLCVVCVLWERCVCVCLCYRE